MKTFSSTKSSDILLNVFLAIAVDNLADGDDDDDGGGDGENAEEGETAEVMVQEESKEPGHVSLSNRNVFPETVF